MIACGLSPVRPLARVGQWSATKAVLVGAALFGAAAHAQPYKGSWQPYSKTAESITGKVSIDNKQISFAGAGKPMVLNTQLVDTRAGKWLFAVTGSKTGPVTLISGNTLCGPGQLPTYIMVALVRDILMVSVSTASEPTRLDWSYEMPSGDCGLYNYSR